MESVNPARRYKWFRPRQAARAEWRQTSTNFATISLFNDSRGSQYLAVRAISLFLVADDGTFAAVQQGTRGTLRTAGTPLVTNAAALPGALYSLDDSNAITPDWVFTNSLTTNPWSHDFPFCILPPNWSLVLQAADAAHTVFAAFMWEAIESDELDFLYQDL